MAKEGDCVKDLDRRFGGANVRKPDGVVSPHGFQKGGVSWLSDQSLEEAEAGWERGHTMLYSGKTVVYSGRMVLYG